MKKTWQHDETGRWAFDEECPGPRWHEVPAYSDRVKCQSCANGSGPHGCTDCLNTGRDFSAFVGGIEQALNDAYAEGRRDEQNELSSVLPGTTYMDPPDGGAPTILEQLQRQAKDAARYLWLRNHGLRYANVGLGSDCEGRNVVDFSPTFTIPEPVGMSYEDNEWSLTDLDAAIDAAMKRPA